MSPARPELSTTVRYDQMFKDIKPDTVTAIREWVQVTHFFRTRNSNPDMTLRDLQALADALSNIYGVSKITRIKYDSHEYYVPATQQISIPKPVSLVSFLHEYRHHLQHTGHRQRSRDIEIDARGWSISLFRLALPQMFEDAWKANRIWYMPPYQEGHD